MGCLSFKHLLIRHLKKLISVSSNQSLSFWNLPFETRNTNLELFLKRDKNFKEFSDVTVSLFLRSSSFWAIYSGVSVKGLSSDWFLNFLNYLTYSSYCSSESFIGCISTEPSDEFESWFWSYKASCSSESSYCLFSETICG